MTMPRASWRESCQAVTPSASNARTRRSQASSFEPPRKYALRIAAQDVSAYPLSMACAAACAISFPIAMGAPAVKREVSERRSCHGAGRPTIQEARDAA